MSQDVQYITNEGGTRVGVLLDIGTYERLAADNQDSELLTNISREELLALAETKLATEEQSQLDELLARNAEGQLSSAEEEQLDKLLTQIDNLNILKTRARYTLQHLATLAS